MTTKTRREKWESKPTAGHETHGQSAVYGPDGKTIALVYDGEANAALIAAAPELLESLKWIIAKCEAVKDNPRRLTEAIFDIMEECETAIAKAEGRS